MEFKGRTKANSKLILAGFPLILMCIGGFILLKMFADARSFMTIENIGRSIFIALPFYLIFNSLRALKDISFAKLPPSFDVTYKLSESFLELRTSDVLTRVNFADVSKVWDPKKTGGTLKLLMASGQEFSLPAPDNIDELYVNLKLKIKNSSL